MRCLRITRNDTTSTRLRRLCCRSANPRRFKFGQGINQRRESLRRGIVREARSEQIAQVIRCRMRWMLRPFGRIFITREAAEITDTMVVAESKVALMLSGSPVIVRRVFLNQAREIGTAKV